MFKVSARTILELGSELISSDIIAFYELIKNGFDARTTTGVEIHFNVALRRNAYLTLLHKTQASSESLADLQKLALKALNADAPTELTEHAVKILGSAKSVSDFATALTEAYALSHIIVADTGTGMSVEDLDKNFLVVGTASRKREVEAAMAKGLAKAPFLGEKGIGRLSAMRLGNRLRVETARANDSKINLLEINWSDFADLDAMVEDIDVTPKKAGSKPSASWSGTKIIVSELTEDWTESRLKEMVERDFARLTDPFLDPKERPRIAIFWNDERLSIPWMDQKLLEHAHAYVHGDYSVVDGVPRLKCTLEAWDLGFTHPREIEKITIAGPDLDGLLVGTSQEIHKTALINAGAFSFNAHWYNRRRLGKIDGIGEMKAVRALQEKWSGILLFRDGFRVFPYGDDDDDWLALDRKAFGRKGYSLNKTQFVGRVRIGRAENPALVDQTNREGLRVTPEQQVLVMLMQCVVNDQLFRFMGNVEKQYKSQKIDLAESKAEISTLEERAKTALRMLKKLAPPDGQEAVEDLQQALFEFSDFAERARQRISEVEQESQQMVEMAGVGLMVEVVAHELARASENALENLEALRGRSVPQDVRATLEALRAQLKSLSKRLRILDPLSISGRQRTETFLLDDLVRDTLEAHEAQFKRHRIHLELDLPKKPMRVKAVKGMIVQILENLISNAKYWLQIRKAREEGLRSTITIVVHDGPPTIIFEDNGSGIAPENHEKVFRAFFSLKEKSKRRGLGLFIARECAQFNGGSLVLDETRNKQTGRLHRFTFELPSGASVHE
jgi:signal transduction histidine kinase